MSLETRSNITWVRYGIANLVGATLCPYALNQVRYRLVKGRIARYLSMEELAVRPLTLRSIRGHDVLLDTAQDLLNSIVELSGQHNREPNGSHT